jgi:hypothetical protein
MAEDKLKLLADNAADDALSGRVKLKWSREMSRISALVLTLAFCSAALAEPVMYVCERPAWDGKDGCGPNNTYETYSMLVDTEDFEDRHAKYTFRKSKGCDKDKGSKYKYSYGVKDGTIVFGFYPKPSSAAMGRGKQSTIKLDLETMTAVMSGVKDSPVLSCRVE